MLLVEKADRYAKKKRRVLDVAADPHGFWVAMLTVSLQTRSSFEVSIAAPSYGLVTIGSALPIEKEDEDESPSSKVFSFAAGGRLVWNTTGTRLAVLICNSIHFISVEWIDCRNGSTIGTAQEAIFAATSVAAGESLLSEVLSVNLSIQGSCSQKGTALKAFSSFPDCLFVIHEGSIHQLDWSGNTLKIIVTSNVQDRWLYRIWDDSPAAIPLNLISIVDAQHFASPGQSSTAAVSTRSENFDSLEEVDLNALDDSASFVDMLTPSLKTRCIADVQCLNRFALLVSFCDGSISLYVEQGSQAPSSPVTALKISMSPRVHLVCQVAYPMLLLPGKAVPAGSRLLHEPQVYEKNRGGDYAVDAVTLEEVFKYLRVNENVLASYHSQIPLAAETASQDSISVSLFRKIARSISIVNGVSKEDIAEVCTVEVLPTPAATAFHSAIPQTSNFVDAVALVRVRHLSEDPRFDDLARYNSDAHSLHNIRVDSGVSYLVTKMQFSIHSNAAADISCREAYKLCFSRNGSSQASVEMKVFGLQEQPSSSSAGMVAIVHDGVLSIRAIDCLDCVLNTVQLLHTSPPRICIAANRFILYVEQTLHGQDSTQITVSTFSCQQRGCPNLWVDESSGSLTHLVHKWSTNSSSMEPANSNRCGSHELASERRVESLPKALQCALLVHRFLPLIMADSKLSSLSMLVAYRLLMTLGKPSWSIDQYLAFVRNINQKADSQYLAFVKSIDRPRLEATIASYLLPELFVFCVRTQKWKSLLLSIGSTHLLPRNASVKLVKTIPCVSYHFSAASNEHTSASRYSFSEQRNTNVSMWDIDVEAFERSTSIIDSTNGIEGGPMRQLVLEESSLRSRSSSLGSSSNPNIPRPREDIGVANTKRELSNLTSSSAPINAKSQLSQQHLQVLELKWWGTHSLLLITLRKAQHFVEIISRDSVPFHHNFSPSSPQHSASHHNVGKVHRLIPLPVGFIPKLWTFREVHNVSEEATTPNILNHFVVIVGNEKIFFAYLLTTIVNGQRETVEYNVVELWNTDLERVLLPGGETNAVSMAEHLQSNGGIKRVETFVQQAPMLKRQEAIFNSLSHHYSPMVLKSGTCVFVPFVALLVVDGFGGVLYMDAIHGVARPIPNRVLAVASSKLCTSALCTATVEGILVAGIHNVFHPHYGSPPAQASEQPIVWNDAIILQRRAVDHVQRHKLLALLTLSKFKLLSKYAKDPVHSIFAENEASFNIASQPRHSVMLLGWQWPAHSTTEMKGNDHATISYMPGADKVDAWLHEHLGRSYGSRADSREALLVQVDWMPAFHSRKHLAFSQGLWVGLQNCQVVGSSFSYFLLEALFRFYARSVRAAAGLQEDGSGCASDVCIVYLSGSPVPVTESYAMVDMLKQCVGRSVAKTGFSTKQLSHLLESLFLAYVHPPSLIGGHTPAVFEWHSNYVLLSSFLYSFSDDLYLAIISRVLRQTEPFISRRLFPVQLHSGNLHPLILPSSLSSGSASMTLFTLFRKTLQKPLLLCTSQLLSPLCEALGGTESLMTVRVCTAICLEYLEHALRHVFVDSALQCLDFTERLLTIHSTLAYDESIDKFDLRRLQMDVATCTAKLRHVDSSSSVAPAVATPASALPEPTAPIELSGQAESGIVHGLRWLLGQLGVVVDGQALHAAQYNQELQPPKSACSQVNEERARNYSEAASICNALICVQCEIGENLLADILSSGTRFSQPQHTAATTTTSKPKAGDANATDTLRTSLPRETCGFHKPSAQNVYAAHEPITSVPLRVVDRVGMLFGALLAHRLRALLSESKQQRHGRLHAMPPKSHDESLNNRVHTNGASQISSSSSSCGNQDHNRGGSCAHLSRNSSAATETVNTHAEANGHSACTSHTLPGGLSSTAVIPSPLSVLKSASDSVASSFHHGSALLLILSTCQSSRACKLLRRHLSITISPLLEKLLGPSSACSQSISNFDFAAYAKQLSRGSCEALYLDSGLMPMLTEEVSVLVPFWHILRLHRHLPHAAGASKPQYQLRPEMLKQALSAQYVYKLAQLEQLGYRAYVGAGKDEQGPLFSRASCAVMYYGLFQDDSLGVPCELPYTIHLVVRAIVTIFLLLKDPHIALCALYTLRNLFEDDVRDRILAIAKQLTRLHRFQSKLGALGECADEALGEDTDRRQSSAVERGPDLPDAASAGKEGLQAKVEEIRRECFLGVDELLFRFVS